MALTFNDEQEAELLKLLGLPEAAPGDTDAGLTLDTITDLAHQVEGLDPVKPSSVAAAAKRNGLEVIDTDTAAALRRDAAEGRTIKASAARAKTEAVVSDAIAKGKITASRQRHWVTLIEADPGMADVLAAVPNETAVPLTDIGHSVETASNPDESVWFYA